MAAMTDAGEPPMCKACRHPHHPWQKCPICGHAGKAKAYRRYEAFCKSTGPTPAVMHYRIFDRSNTKEDELNKLWQLARIVRRHVFVTELGIPEDKEFDAHDLTSRHLLSFVGDAPISYLRWRVVEEAGSQFALIGRLCTLKRHRLQKCAKKLMKRAILDIGTQQRSLSAIVTNCPAQPIHKHLADSCGFKRVGQQFEQRGRVHQRYILSRPF